MSQSKNVTSLRRRERKDIKRLEKKAGSTSIIQGSGGGGTVVPAPSGITQQQILKLISLRA